MSANQLANKLIASPCEYAEQAAQRLAELERDAARYRWLRANALEQLLNPRSLDNGFMQDLRTYWKLPRLICSGPVGGFMTFDESVDAAMEKQQ